jgi:hypothetical protein
MRVILKCREKPGARCRNDAVPNKYHSDMLHNGTPEKTLMD